MWIKFQRAPTLGGECYYPPNHVDIEIGFFMFQRAPTLGGECYTIEIVNGKLVLSRNVSTGTHPWG